MPRPPLAKQYIDFIKSYADSNLSNYRIVDEMHASFDKTLLDAIGQNIPVESTVRRVRKELNRSIETACNQINLENISAERAKIDTPWQLRRIDPDGIPPHICSWIACNILTNNFIMNELGLSRQKLTNHLNPLTCRTAMWISALFSLLEGEHPQLIWSIAWMYSGYELSCANSQSKFDTRAFDYYTAYKPWKSIENHMRYERAIKNKWVTDIKKVSAFAILHQLQILSLT